MERKPSDADGVVNHEGDDVGAGIATSVPCCSPCLLIEGLFSSETLCLAGDPAGDVHLGCCLSYPLWQMTWPRY